MQILGYVAAVIIGLALGLMGGGGSILTVPVFVYLLGFGAKLSVAMSLAVVGAVSLFGAAAHWRHDNIDVSLALVFGSVAMVGTWGGAYLARYVSGTFQLLLFSAVMLGAAVFMFRDTQPVDPGEVPESHVSLAKFPLIAVEGIAVGVLTGLVGVGGGFLIVPAMVLVSRVPMKKAVGTSLLVIAMKSAAGFWEYSGQVQVHYAFVGGFSALAILGIVAGGQFVQHIEQRRLKRGFAVFLVVMGTFMLLKETGVLAGVLG
ncbi:MAG: sulfite exporter TauE/SafE family protein [Bradymonadaceae bacterium]